MKNVEEIKKLKQECRERMVSIRDQVRGKLITKELGKSRENKESKQIEFLDSIIALLDYGYNEIKLNEWRCQLEEKLDLIKRNNPEAGQYDTDETLKQKIQTHEKACGKSKIVSQISNIDFILN